MPLFFKNKTAMPDPGCAARPDRSAPATHLVNGAAQGSVSGGQRDRHVGLGCFWGAEKVFWHLPGVLLTAVGYAAAHPEPILRRSLLRPHGHTETVRIVFDPSQSPIPSS